MGLFSKRKKHEAKEDPAQQAATIAKLESELTAAENNVRQLKPEVIKIQEEWQEVDASLINTNSQIASIGEVKDLSIKRAELERELEEKKRAAVEKKHERDLARGKFETLSWVKDQGHSGERIDDKCCDYRRQMEHLEADTEHLCDERWKCEAELVEKTGKIRDRKKLAARRDELTAECDSVRSKLEAKRKELTDAETRRDAIKKQLEEAKASQKEKTQSADEMKREEPADTTAGELGVKVTERTTIEADVKLDSTAKDGSKPKRKFSISKSVKRLLSSYKKDDRPAAPA